MSGSSSFSSKIIELSGKILPDIKSKETRIANLTHEKPGTIKNWLFKNTLPSEMKKLKVADRMGVSQEYLFNEDAIPEPPTAIYLHENNAFALPVITENNLYNISIKNIPTLVFDRYTLSIKDSTKDKINSLKLTYCFEVKQITFPPFIFEGDIVVFNESFSGVCEFFLKTSPRQVKILRSDNASNRLISKKGEIEKNDSNAFLLPIILIVNDGVKQ